LATLQQRIQDDLKTAMRAADALARETLRMVLADLKNKRIELGRELEDEDVVGVLQKGVKNREESAQQFAAGGRQDLVDKERAEIAVIGRYLPEQLSEDEVREIVRAAIAELGVAGKQDIGKLMKAVMARHKGRVDGKLVQRFAGELLS
jgi:hypothetical protein